MCACYDAIHTLLCIVVAVCTQSCFVYTLYSVERASAAHTCDSSVSTPSRLQSLPHSAREARPSVLGPLFEQDESRERSRSLETSRVRHMSSCYRVFLYFVATRVKILLKHRAMSMRANRVSKFRRDAFHKIVLFLHIPLAL